MNSTETKTELPRDWQIFREANSDGQWSEWRLNASGKNLSSQNYRECVHVREALKGDDTLRTRLEAVEKERDELKALVNSKVIASVVEDKLGQNLMVRKITALEKANGELVAALKQCSDLLRAVRYSMDRDVPFPSLEKINAGIATAEAMKGEG